MAEDSDLYEYLATFKDVEQDPIFCDCCGEEISEKDIEQEKVRVIDHFSKKTGKPLKDWYCPECTAMIEEEEQKEKENEAHINNSAK